MQAKSFLLILMTYSSIVSFGQPAKPLRIGIAGLTHDHVGGLLSRAHDSDIQIVGIAESNRQLAERYLKKYNLPSNLLYPSLDEMLDKCKPEAVCAFNTQRLLIDKKTMKVSLRIMLRCGLKLK